MDEVTCQLDAVRKRLLEIHRRLTRHYTVPVIHCNDRLGPVSQLVSSVIATQSSAERADRAFRNLCSAYWTWSEIRDAPVRDVHRALVDVDRDGQKTATIKHALNQISDRSSWNRPGLDFLDEYSDADALQWLMCIPGVRANAAAEVLLMSTLRRAVLPVDCAHQRVAQRAGLVIPGLNARAAQARLNAILPDNWRAGDVEAHYFVMRAHAHDCCVIRQPKCRSCLMRDLCQFPASFAGHEV